MIFLHKIHNIDLLKIFYSFTYFIVFYSPINEISSNGKRMLRVRLPFWLSRTMPMSKYFSGSRPLRHNEVQLYWKSTNEESGNLWGKRSHHKLCSKCYPEVLSRVYLTEYIWRSYNTCIICMCESQQIQITPCRGYCWDNTDDNTSNTMHDFRSRSRSTLSMTGITLS